MCLTNVALFVLNKSLGAMVRNIFAWAMSHDWYTTKKFTELHNHFRHIDINVRANFVRVFFWEKDQGFLHLFLTLAPPFFFPLFSIVNYKFGAALLALFCILFVSLLVLHGVQRKKNPLKSRCAKKKKRFKKKPLKNGIIIIIII